MSISVILPTYNEAGNILELIDRIKNVLSRLENDYEIIVIDDNSPDGTAEVVERDYGHDKALKLFKRKSERGLATAIRYGIDKASGSMIILMDTDFNHNPDDIPRLIRGLDGYDVIVGSRYIPGGGMKTSRLRYQFSRLFNLFARLTLSLNTMDNLSGFLCFKREILKSIDVEKVFIGYGDYCIRFLYQCQDRGLKILEIPVVYELRHSGKGKTKFLKYLIQYTMTVLKIKFGNGKDYEAKWQS